MAIDDPTTIDSMGIDKVTGEVVMMISDHLSWDDELAHFRVFEDKINAYLRFANNGQLSEQLPRSEGRKRRIDLIYKYKPTPSASQVLDRAKADLETRGISFCYKPLPEGY